VYVNGRELHPVDVQRLRGIYGTVEKGRYWMTADGIGGREGGPAIFNLGTAAGDRRSGGGGVDRGAFGTWGSDGTCWYVSVEGGDVMGPGC
jgi:hypothetical protein